MKKSCFKMTKKLLFGCLVLGNVSMVLAQIADNNLNSFDSTAQLAPNGSPAGFSGNNGTYGGGIWYGSSTVTWDGTQDNTGNGGGSAYIVSTWGSDQANPDSPFEVYLGSPSDQLYYIPSPVPLSQYLYVSFDFKWDNSSTMTIDEFNNMSLVPTNYLKPGTTLNNAGQLAVSSAQNGADAFIGSTNVPDIATNQWVHFVFPINSTEAGLDGSMGILLRPANYFSTSANLTNDLTAKFWIDNVFLKGTAAPPPPPTLSITKATPGLNFVQGSISGQFDRQNIITANGANSTANYTWAGVATGANPVTYSFNISQYAAPDLNYHIYFYQTAGAGGASAPDYNQPNVLIFQLSPQANGTVTAALSWKTNSPSSGTISNGLFGSSTTITNPTAVGAWQLQFTSNTGGTLFAPGGFSYPFTLDPSVAAALANPITVNFGINPAVNNTAILGETVVVSQIGISGVDPLSVNYPTTDNFLADSTLDTNTFTVNAFTPASILFVPTNTSYSVNWNLPDNGFSLTVSSSITNRATGANLSQPVVTLFPGRRVLIPSSTLPAGQAGFFSLVKRAFTQLQVLLPGETNAPNTSTGKIGTPTPASNGGAPVLITINAVDANFNPVNAPGDTVVLTSSDISAVYAQPGALVNGTTTGQIQFNTSGSQTVTASDSSNTNILSNTSSPITVQ
jgi:hypothetical protein